MVAPASPAVALPEPAPWIEPGAGPLRILAVLDASGESLGALREAVRLATAGHARLTIATVVESPPWWTFASAYAVPVTVQELRRASVHRAESTLAAARCCVPDGISVTTCLLHGRRSRALAREALEGGYDLVVAETAPAQRPGARWRGRRACALVRRCPASVLVVRPPDP